MENSDKTKYYSENLFFTISSQLIELIKFPCEKHRNLFYPKFKVGKSNFF